MAAVQALTPRYLRKTSGGLLPTFKPKKVNPLPRVARRAAAVAEVAMVAAQARRVAVYVRVASCEVTVLMLLWRTVVLKIRHS